MTARVNMQFDRRSSYLEKPYTPFTNAVRGSTFAGSTSRKEFQQRRGTRTSLVVLQRSYAGRSQRTRTSPIRLGRKVDMVFSCNVRFLR